MLFGRLLGDQNHENVRHRFIIRGIEGYRLPESDVGQLNSLEVLDPGMGNGNPFAKGR